MKHKAIPKNKRIEVYNKYNGHCVYCGCELEYKDMQVDHLSSVYRNWANEATETNNWKFVDDGHTQDDSMENLMPSCRMCNFYKNSSTLEEFRNHLSNMLMRNVRRPFDYRLAIKYGLIEEKIHPIQFYFESDTDYVDLGLSVKWAKCNVGANSEEEYGDYYTFDETVEIFVNRYDRMPSKEEQNELLSGTTQEIIEINGILGTKFTSKVNTNYIFIPFAGYGYNGDFSGAGSSSRCWGSSINDSYGAWYLRCSGDGYRGVGNIGRYFGFSVRGVSDK